MSIHPPGGTILLADDDEAVRAVLARALSGQGYAVHAVADGHAAARSFEATPFDLVLSDIDMPGQGGLELLKAIRERDLDVPVVLLTGSPTLESALLAIEHGASHYLTKPIDLSVLYATIRRALLAGRLARARRDLVPLTGDAALQISDLAGLAARFEQAVEGLYMVWQPIVRWSDRSVFAYEALMRSTEPTMPSPEALLDAADRLGRMVDLGRRTRRLSSEARRPADTWLFMNLHPRDLTDEALYALDTPLAWQASQIVLEITERTRLEGIPDLGERVGRLRTIGYRIAVDDIGAGYAGLTSFAVLEPDFVKLDGVLVRNIHESNTKRRLVGSMVRACADLGVQVVGEGIESEPERDALVDLGCDLLQGFLFARPDRPFAVPAL
ncbi:MAG: EAL domain-containing protein [Vicinamibacterales bacterium]